MNFSRQLGILIVSALLALLVLAPNEPAAAGAPPPNDDFADAAVISELPYSDAVDMRSATIEEDEIWCSSDDVFTVLHTVWYRYTASRDDILVARVQTARFGPIGLGAYEESETGFRKVGCDGYREAPGEVAQVAFEALAGTTYYFQVDHRNPTSAPSTMFSLKAPVRPEHDDFADAGFIDSLPFSASLNTGAATSEPGEAPPCMNDVFGARAVATVWYAFTPSEDMVLVADTTGSDFTVFTNVFEVSERGLNPVGCEESAPGVTGSRLGFQVEAGQDYYFQVGGRRYFVERGELAFLLSAGEPPPNDDFADSAVVEMLPFSAEVDAIAAGSEPDEPTPACLAGPLHSSIWYRVAVDERSLVVADVASDEVAPIIGVYRGGGGLDALTEAWCGEAGFGRAIVGFEAVPGEIYVLQIASAASGTVNLRVTSRSMPDCPQPAFTVPDPTGDVNDFFGAPAPIDRQDIISTGISWTSDHVCVRLNFAEDVSPPVRGAVFFDTDPALGSDFVESTCDPEGVAGVDLRVNMFPNFGQLAMIWIDTYGVMLFEERAVTLAVQNDQLNGGERFRYAAWVFTLLPDRGSEDCAPDRSFISVPAVPNGDANCDGDVDSRDAAAILQVSAGLVRHADCDYVSDANGDGTIDSIDAALILQLDAGLIDVLPGVSRSAVDAVIRATAELAGVPEDQVVLRSKEPQTWPDGCLGLPEPGEACTEALVEGYRIRLKAWFVPLPAPTPPSPTAVPADFYSWRTNLDGSEVRLEGIAIP